MIRTLLLLLIVTFSQSIKGDESMNLKNIESNENYTFQKDVYKIYKRDYFVINLIKFIRKNFDILTIDGEIKNLDKEENMISRFYPSKIKKLDILEGVIKYVIILQSPTENTQGLYFSYTSWISRNSINELWNRSNIYGYYDDWDIHQEFGFFDEDDFNSLGLIFKNKKLLKHLDSSEWSKYTSMGYDIKDPSTYDKISKKAYAIYEFETVYNNHKLKLSFTVSKDKYMSNINRKDLPFEWSQLFIERID